LPAGLSWYWEVKRNINFAGIISFRRSWKTEERKNIMFIKRSFRCKKALFINSKLKFDVIWKQPEESKKTFTEYTKWRITITLCSVIFDKTISKT
jgi:hypothetical protein